MRHRPARTLVPVIAFTATLAVGLLIGALWLRSTHKTPAQPVATPAPRAPALTPADVLGSLPDDIDLAVIVDNAADLRTSTVGASAITVLDDAGVLKDLSAAWAALSTQLGWTNGEAFDRLLGRRVVLVSKAVAGTNERRWAVLSDVDADTDLRLRERLQVAPRAIDKGHQILSVEKGQYELTAHRRTGHGDGPGAITLVFGPAGRAELFDQMVGVLAAGAPSPLSRHDAHAQATRLGDAEVLVAATFDRPSPTEPAAADAGASAAAPHERHLWNDFVLLAGGRDSSALPAAAGAPRSGTAWRSRVLVRDAARRDALAAVEATSDAPFKALSAGSLLTLVQSAPLPTVLGSAVPVDSLLGWLPLPPRAKALTSERQALSVRTFGPDELVACTVALRTPHTRALAGVLDPAIARGVQTLEERLGVAAAAPPDFGGVAPTAARVVGVASAPGGPLSILTSRPVAIAWAYPSRPTINGPLNTERPTCSARQLADAADARLLTVSLDDPDGTDRPGWWALTVCQTAPPAQTLQQAIAQPAPAQTQSLQGGGTEQVRLPTPAELVRNDANALLNDDPGAETARWVALGSARPAALEALLPAAVPDLRGFRSLLRRFDDVGLRLHITEEGDILGDLSLRLAPTSDSR